MTDREQLAEYVETWWQAIADFTALAERLTDDDGTRPTDLPGWTVHDVVAHVAHLEHLSVGGAHDDVPGIEVGSPAHVGSPMAVFTEQGVVARRGVRLADLVASIRLDTPRRHQQLMADVPDGDATADGAFGLIGWTWSRLLRNRPLDVWMHEQDIRRAVDRPGGMDSRAASHTADYLSEAFGFVVAKRAGAPPGTSAVLEVEGSPAIAVEVDDAGRGRRLEAVPTAPAVLLSTDRETFVLAAGGRRPAPEGAVKIEGDAELGRRIVEVLATTP